MQNSMFQLIATIRRVICPKTGIFILMLSFSQWAMALNVQAVVSKNQVQVNEPIQLTIEADDALNSDELQFDVLAKDFNYSTPSRSSGTSIINGDISRYTSWRLNIAPKRTGTITIPSFDVGGKKTAPISLTVTESTSDPTADLEAVKIGVSLNKDEGYIGEHFIYNVRLMIGTQLQTPTLLPPQGEGLRIEQVGEDKQAEAVMNGRRYLIINRQYQVTPERSGVLEIQGAKLEGSEIKGTRYGPQIAIPLERVAENLSLNIQDKPADYQGFWLPTTDLQLEQTWSPNDLDTTQAATVGEPIHREIILKIAQVDQSSMPNFNIDYPDNIKVYDDKPVYSQEGQYTVMRVKQVLIPRQQGDVTLPNISIKWFNTTTDTQEETEVSGLTLKVAPNKDMPAPLPIADAAISEQTTESVQVVEQISSGFWPWLTALFASLWLFTLTLYLKKPSAAQGNQRARLCSTSTDLTWDKLIESVKTNDAIQVTYLLNQGLLYQCSEDLQKEIMKEVNAMQAARYRSKSSVWNGNRLLSLLTQAKKEKLHVKADTSLAEFK